MKKILFKQIFLVAGIALMAIGCNADDDLTQPNANQTATANFKLARPGQMVLKGANVDVINESKNATSYLWDLGDGSTSTEANPRHSYAKAGTYTIKLTVTDATGKQTSFEDSVNVFGTIPEERVNSQRYSSN